MYYAVKIALKDLGVEGVFPTDIGCYTLESSTAPDRGGTTVSAWGPPISTAAGFPASPVRRWWP